MAGIDMANDASPVDVPPAKRLRVEPSSNDFNMLRLISGGG